MRTTKSAPQTPTVPEGPQTLRRSWRPHHKAQGSPSAKPGGRGPEAAGSGAWRYLEGALGEAGQVEAVVELLVPEGAALCPHFVGADQRGLPLEHKVTVAGPQQFWCPLFGVEGQL